MKLPKASHELLYFIKQKASDDDFTQLVFVTLTPKRQRSTKKHPTMKDSFTKISALYNIRYRFIMCRLEARYVNEIPNENRLFVR